MYYKAIWNETDGCSWYYLEAETEEEAHKKATEMYPEDVDNLTIEPTTFEVVLEEEKATTMRNIRGIYFDMHYKIEKLSIREYSNIVKDIETNKQKQLDVYREANRYWSLWSLIERKCDMEVMTVAQMYDAIRRLLVAEGSEKFQIILDALPQKQ